MLATLFSPWEAGEGILLSVLCGCHWCLDAGGTNLGLLTDSIQNLYACVHMCVQFSRILV